MSGPFLVTAKCRLPAKELTEKNALLAHTLFIYHKSLGHECMWVLGITCFLPVIREMFNYVRDTENVLFKKLVFIVIIHLKKIK